MVISHWVINLPQSPITNHQSPITSPQRCTELVEVSPITSPQSLIT
ncbi:MAG: hypothetical protein ACKO2Z_05355 [Sphaerospermopsis kisseleviana]